MIISNSSFKPTTSASPTNEEGSKKAEKERPRKAAQSSRAKTATKGATNRSQPYSSKDSRDGSVSAASTEKEEENQSRDEDILHAIVKADYTPVYSVNSRQSNVVKLLKKGDRVATDLEVIDEKGRWTIVRKGDLSRPGFVLDENLQRANTAKKAEK